MDQQNPSYISCTEDEQKDDVLIFFRDTLEKQIEAVVDTISPLYGDDFTQAHWKQCACVRITKLIRTKTTPKDKHPCIQWDVGAKLCEKGRK